MPLPLLINEFLKAIAWMIGIYVVVEFVRTRDGMLRIIMIVYFSVEVFIYFTSSVNTYLEWKRINVIDRLTFQDVLLIPKDIIKIWLLFWLIKNRKKS